MKKGSKLTVELVACDEEDLRGWCINMVYTVDTAWSVKMFENMRRRTMQETFCQSSSTTLVTGVQSKEKTLTEHCPLPTSCDTSLNIRAFDATIRARIFDERVCHNNRVCCIVRAAPQKGQVIVSSECSPVRLRKG
jgi:hypothetical protein